MQDDVTKIQTAWAQSPESSGLVRQSGELAEKNSKKITVDETSRPGLFRITLSLLHRSFIKSYRDVVAYGIRIVMYMGTSNAVSQDIGYTNSSRFGNYDGHCLATSKNRSGPYSAVHQCNCTPQAVPFECNLTNHRVSFSDQHS